jgi:hypothetical protein
MDATDLTALSDSQLKQRIEDLRSEERDLSYRRRLLHGQLDLLSSELVRRLRGRDEGELSVVDVDALARILAGRLPDMDRLEGGSEGGEAEAGETGR